MAVDVRGSGIRVQHSRSPSTPGARCHRVMVSPGRSEFRNEDRFLIESVPVNPANEPIAFAIEQRPFQRRSASIGVSDKLIGRPAGAGFLNVFRPISSNGLRPGPFVVRMKVMNPIGTKARGNCLGIGVVAALNILSDDLLHALSQSGMVH